MSYFAEILAMKSKGAKSLLIECSPEEKIGSQGFDEQRYAIHHGEHND